MIIKANYNTLNSYKSTKFLSKLSQSKVTTKPLKSVPASAVKTKKVFLSSRSAETLIKITTTEEILMRYAHFLKPKDQKKEIPIYNLTISLLTKFRNNSFEDVERTLFDQLSYNVELLDELRQLQAKIPESKTSKLRTCNTYIWLLENELFNELESDYQDGIELSTFAFELGCTDALTGLPNRTRYDSEIQNLYSSFQNSGQIFSLLLIDADKFKDVNDKYGHVVGDEVLQFIAYVISTSVREHRDTLTRWGGEEFAVLLPGASKDEASLVFKRIQEELAQISFTKQNIKTGTKETFTVTVSGGIKVINSPCESLEKVKKEADEALYRSKEEGRNRVTISQTK